MITQDNRKNSNDRSADRFELLKNILAEGQSEQDLIQNQKTDFTKEQDKPVFIFISGDHNIIGTHKSSLTVTDKKNKAHLIVLIFMLLCSFFGTPFAPEF